MLPDAVAQWQQARAAENAAAHSICQVEGTCYAWKPVPGDEFAGEMSHARDEDELLAKLGG